METVKEHGDLSAEFDGCSSELSYETLEKLVRNNRKKQESQRNSVLLRDKPKWMTHLERKDENSENTSDGKSIFQNKPGDDSLNYHEETEGGANLFTNQLKYLQKETNFPQDRQIQVKLFKEMPQLFLKIGRDRRTSVTFPQQRSKFMEDFQIGDESFPRRSSF